MIRFGKLLSLLLPCWLAISSAAGAADVTPRPKIGLALSGGGAKGIAHIGVLKVLKEAGVEIDFIAGTSMGSIVGALYSIGYEPEAMERIVLEQDWQEILSDGISRKNLSMEEKLEDGRYMLSLPIRNRRIGLPSGLISGQKVSMMLTDLTLAVHHVDDFSVLPIPFRCIATDLETGEPVVLSRGNLADALRASMSIPTIFRPVEVDGRLLADGFLVRNLPVQDVREMGADLVIGVDVGAPLYKKEELTSLFRVMDQVVNFRGAEDTRRQQELCDILIQPDLSAFSPMDFYRADSLIAAGERAARELLPRLTQLSPSSGPALPSEGQEDYRQSPIRQFYVTELRFEGLHDVSKDLLLGKLQLNVPSRLTVAQVEEAVERAWGSRFFERVSYRIEPGQNGTRLVIRVVEQSDDYLRLGVHYDNDLKSAVLFNLMYRNLGFEGSKLSLSANLSENESYQAEYLIYTNWQPGILVGLANAYTNLNIFLYDDIGQVLANLDFSLYIAELSLATVFSNKFAIGISGQYRKTQISKIFAPVDWNDGSYSLLSAIAFATLDTWDRTIYPRSGVYLNLSSQLVADLFDSDFADLVPVGYELPGVFAVHTAQLQGSIPLRSNISALYGAYAGAATHSRIPDDYKFYLGGQYLVVDQGFPFMGLKFLERPGTHAYVIQAGMQYEVGPGQVVQLRANIGEAADNASALFDSKGVDIGGGLTLGWHSPIGPIEYSLSYGNRRRELLSYVNVGYRF